MREIKFRAWDKQEKQMYRVLAIDFENKEFLELENEDSKKTVLLPKRKFDKGFVLMQFTGFYSWWEDDLFDLDGYGIHQLIWDGKWSFKNIITGDLFDCYGIFHHWPKVPKKVGNIHQNPELLEGYGKSH